MDVPLQPVATLNGEDINSLPKPAPAVTTNELRLKYVDDQTQGEVIQLDKALILQGNKEGPRDFHDRHGNILPPNNSIVINA